MNKLHVNVGVFSLILLWIVSESSMGSLKDIIYTSEGQLCSTSIEVSVKSSCIESNIEFESPAWSPDGKAIVAESRNQDGSRGLSLLRPDGTSLRKIAKSSGFHKPVWSQDGQYIYAVNHELGASIGRWDEDGSNLQSIPIRGIPEYGTLGLFEYIQMISLSPDGASIAILAEGFHKMLIGEYKQDSFQIVTQLPEGFASVGMSVWIDESRLLFVGNEDDRRADLWEMDIRDGSTKKREIFGLRIRDFFALSPDKKSIVVCGVAEGSKNETRWNLWNYTFSSSELVRLTSGTEDVSPSWKR